MCPGCPLIRAQMLSTILDVAVYARMTAVSAGTGLLFGRLMDRFFGITVEHHRRIIS